MALLKHLSPRWHYEGLVNSLQSLPTEGGALLRLPEFEAARISRANLSYKRLCRRRPRQVNIEEESIVISEDTGFLQVDERSKLTFVNGCPPVMTATPWGNWQRTNFHP